MMNSLAKRQFVTANAPSTMSDSLPRSLWRLPHADSVGVFGQPSPTPRLVCDELAAVRAEFAEFSFDLPDETVTVYTDEITLEGIDLGRFEIRLQGRELEGTPYIIIPESPHYPSSRSDVPHPHVLSERLCEGNASAPLAHALRTGRFSDYFQIIRQTLSSYNSESPYVSLSAWYGVNCHACGGHVSDDDESYYCEDCHAETATDEETSDETADEEVSDPDATTTPHASLSSDGVGQVAVLA